MRIKRAISLCVMLSGLPLIAEAHLSEQLGAVQHAAQHTNEYGGLALVLIVIAVLGAVAMRR